MSSQNSPPETPRRLSRWSAPGRSPDGRRRLAFRLIGLPILAVAAVILYRGIRAHFVLPECDSQSAQQTLSQVLKQLQLEPVRYAPIKTISSTRDKVVCNAAMPLPDGATVVADYTFFWQGSKPNMRYSIRREPAQNSPGASRGAS